MKKLFLLGVVMLAVTAPHAEAGWTRTTHRFSRPRVIRDGQYARSFTSPRMAAVRINPFFFSVARYLSDRPRSSSGYAWLRTRPASVSGFSRSRDSLVNFEAKARVVGTGYEFAVWKHIPPGVGEVELLKRVEVCGSVKLENGPCAAAALGFARAWHAFDGAEDELVSRLTRSSAASSSSTVANLEIPLRPGTPAPPTISLPLNATIGLGEYPDDGGGPQFRAATACPVTVFQYDLRAQGVLSTWANVGPLAVAFFGEALASGEMEGSARMTALLLTHATCPPQPPSTGN